MGKNLKYISVLLIIAFIFIVSYALKPGKKNTVKSVNENQIVIDNFDMSKVVDRENNFYIIKAETADMDRISEMTVLKKFHVVYKKQKTNLDIKGPLAEVNGEDEVVAKGKLTGNVNGIDFKTNKKGEFFYDFILKKGYLKNGVVLMDGNNTISCDYIDIDGETSDLKFNGHVKVYYE